MLTKELSRSPAFRTSFIESMYVQAVRELPDGKLWSYEAKLDGYRCLAAEDPSGVVAARQKIHDRCRNALHSFDKEVRAVKGEEHERDFPERIAEL